MNVRQRMKSVVRAALHRCGYSLRRLDAADDNRAVSPYVSSCRVADVSFRFWIANQRAETVYGDGSAWDGMAEPKELLALLCPTDRVLEVGCNLGFFTVLLGKTLGDQGAVFAVDANASNVLISQAQLALNDLSPRCVARHLALAERTGTVTIENTSNAQVIAASSPGGTTVPASTIDELDRAYGPFDFVKIDVEGYEARVLAGAEQTLRRRPKLAIEIHDDQLGRYGSSVEEIFALIGIHDYEGSMISREQPRTSHPFDADAMPRHTIVNLALRPRA